MFDLCQRLTPYGGPMSRQSSRRSRRRASASSPPPTRSDAGRGAWPVAPVATSTGSAWVEPDPDRPTGATLHVNGVPSSYIDLADPGFLAFEYMQNMAAVIDSMPPGPLRAVHLGAAGCSLARQIDATRPGSRQLGIDLDARLIELARIWFDLPRAPRLRLRAGDASAELTTLVPGQADVLVRDVFAGNATPHQLTTVEFAVLAARALAPTGVYLANIADRPPLSDARRELAAVAAAWGPDPWPRLGLIAEPAVLKGRRYGNLVLMACGPAGLDPGEAALARRLRTLPVPARLITGDELKSFANLATPSRDPAARSVDKRRHGDVMAVPDDA